VTSTLQHDRWTARDRFLAGAFVVYVLVGFAHNYARISPRIGEGARGVLVMAWVALLGLTLLFLAWEVVRRRRSVETLGFLVGTWPSSALTVVVACLAASLIKIPLTKAAFAAGIAVPLLAVLVEEILFRPVLITWLHDGLARARTGWALAVLLSAAIWTVVHVPSKSASMLVGLFVTGVLLGALYAWSGTNVAGYVLHALANSGSGGAVIMFVLCLVLGAGGRLIERRTRRDLAPDGEAHDGSSVPHRRNNRMTTC
jgi:hypothetical protein